MNKGSKYICSADGNIVQIPGKLTLSSRLLRPGYLIALFLAVFVALLLFVITENLFLGFSVVAFTISVEMLMISNIIIAHNQEISEIYPGG